MSKAKIPNEYEVLPDIPNKKYLDAGFRAISDGFRIDVLLYKKYIKLRIFIDPYEPYMEISVINENGDLYAPYYNPEMRHNNLVYKEVIKNYNTFMNKLVKKRILKHREDE